MQTVHVIEYIEKILISAVEDEDDFPINLPPTIIEDLENCGPSYTADALTELEMQVHQILSELIEEHSDKK